MRSLSGGKPLAQSLATRVWSQINIVRRTKSCTLSSGLHQCSMECTPISIQINKVKACYLSGGLLEGGELVHWGARFWKVCLAPGTFSVLLGYYERRTFHMKSPPWGPPKQVPSSAFTDYGPKILELWVKITFLPYKLFTSGILSQCMNQDFQYTAWCIAAHPILGK